VTLKVCGDPADEGDLTVGADGLRLCHTTALADAQGGSRIT
jgi:hypothetical protein